MHLTEKLQVPREDRKNLRERINQSWGGAFTADWPKIQTKYLMKTSFYLRTFCLSELQKTQFYQKSWPRKNYLKCFVIYQSISK